jgi:hypothetical protein
MEDMAMKAQKTYMVPMTEFVVLSTTEKVMQDSFIDKFSGGDLIDTGIVISEEADNSDDGNRSNEWSNHLWDKFG